MKSKMLFAIVSLFVTIVAHSATNDGSGTDPESNSAACSFYTLDATNDGSGTNTTNATNDGSGTSSTDATNDGSGTTDGASQSSIETYMSYLSCMSNKGS